MKTLSRSIEYQEILLNDLLQTPLIEPARQNIQAGDQDIMLSLLSCYSEEWRHFSEQIWLIGTIFIPLSLSGVAFIGSDPRKTFGIAFFSIILIWTWYFLTVRLRVILDKSQRTYFALEDRLLKMGSSLPSTEFRKITTLPKSRLSMRNLRRIIAFAVTIAWILIIIITFI